MGPMRFFGRKDPPETPSRASPEPFPDLRAVEERLNEHEQALDGLAAAVNQLGERIDDQRLAIAEGIERTERAERRIRASVQRARARLADSGLADDALDAEAEQLRFIDGDGSANGRVPPMRESMGGPPARDMSAFPGSW